MTAPTSNALSAAAKTNPLRNRLLIGVSIGAMLLTGVAEAQDRSGGGRVFSGRGGGDPTAAAARAAQEQATRANETNSATQRAITAFRRAAETRQAMNDAQAAARALARATHVNVPNGLGPGGLQVANGVELYPSLWVGANRPVQSEGENGRTNVSIEQTHQQAILNWDSFNVGRETDLGFVQGGADWVALNRVTDASADPTQILGSIKAPGSVYILNRNGIIFGGASQVNVRNLVAATASITDEQFLNRGIYSSVQSGTYSPSFTAAGGTVTVEAGAQISTTIPQSVTTGGGYVLLMGTQVANAGSITTPRGQTLLSAGDNFIIRRGFGTEENQYSTTRGNEVRGLIDAESASGTVINAGQIEASQGDITLAGRTIRQDGVAMATTSVNQRGTIHLLNSASDAEGSVTLGEGSLTLILPELDSDDTALDSQRDALIADSTEANANRASTLSDGWDDRSTLSDRLDQSRVEIVTGGDVLFEGGSQTMANGGQVAVQANAARITVADGASIDVSGTMGVALEMASNSILVNIQGNELRDSPVNRDEDGLRNQNAWVDVRDLILLPAGTGGYEGDRWYTRGGLLEVGGYLANTAHAIGEWTAVGGTITLAANEVVAHQGAVFDISGGSLDYASGYVRSTMMLGADGRMYDVRNAPSYMRFLAVGNAFARTHDRWGPQYTEVFANRLFSRGTTMRWEDGYTVGRDAGHLILSTPTALFDADILAEAVNGQRQNDAREESITDGYSQRQDSIARGGVLALGAYDSVGRIGLHASDVRIGAFDSAVDAMEAGGAIPDDRTGTVWLDAGRLQAAELGGLELATEGSITVERDIVMSDGGFLTLIGSAIDIAANVTVRGGDLRATNQYTVNSARADGSIVTGLAELLGGGGVTLRSGKTIDTRGVWTNLQSGTANPRRLALVDGGDVLLQSSGDVTLEAGARIDSSSGATLMQDGTLLGGRGGDVSLLASSNQTSGVLTIDGDLHAYGVDGGGKLSLSTSGVIALANERYEIGTTLPAGSTAPADLLLAEELVVPAGMVLPADYSFTRAEPGQLLPGQVFVGSATLAADWIVPEGASNIRYCVGTSCVVASPGTRVPRNAVLTASTSNALRSLPAAYVLPADAFPNGLTFASPVVFAAGRTAPLDAIFAPDTAIRAGALLAVDASIQPVDTLNIPDALLRTGFSHYAFNGVAGLVVTADADLKPVMPVYRLAGGRDAVATGSDPTDALELFLQADVYSADPRTGEIVQRRGVDLTLNSGRTTLVGPAVLVGGGIRVEQGASLAVDPGSNVTIGSAGQVMIDGTITAPGGTISITNEMLRESVAPEPGSLSIWIGENARLDASARAFTATDADGQLHGTITDGGTVLIGSRVQADIRNPNGFNAAAAYVIVRDGAVIDVSGTSAEIDVMTVRQGEPVQLDRRSVASDGGSILLDSYYGIYNEGKMLATSGGEGASGGTLSIMLETPILSRAPDAGGTQPFSLQLGRALYVMQETGSPLSADLSAGVADASLAIGYAGLSVDQVTVGGFSDLSLFARDAIAFDGNIDLTAGRSIRMATASINNIVDGGAASVNAPYVTLDGQFILTPTNSPEFKPGMLPEWSQTGTLTVEGGMIDYVNRMNVNVAKLTIDADRDIRFLKFDATPLTETTTGGKTILSTPGDLELIASRIYPSTDADVQIHAGAVINVQGSATRPATAGLRTLTLSRNEGSAAPSTPWSVFGRIAMTADSIVQGANLYAPMGSIALFTSPPLAIANQKGETHGRVDFLTGSITSVSARGLALPYGGTSDSVLYTVDGAQAQTSSLATGLLTNDLNSSQLGVRVQGMDITVNDGATIDVSGGGTITGAAFISGRGGSVDTLTTALANANPGFGVSGADNRVFAIVPGVDIAPVAGGYATEWTGSVPEAGEQITIPAGVPGLPAGTYTLLPANYALVPGAYRVELGARSATRIGEARALPIGSYLASGVRGIAGTGISDSLFTELTITPGATVRTYSSYNELGYDAFQIGRAATEGSLRPLLIRDGKFLTLQIAPLPIGGEARPGNSLIFEGISNFAGAEDGFDGTLVVGGTPGNGSQPRTELVITAQDSATQRTSAIATIAAADIARLGAPTLFLGAGPRNQAGLEVIILGDVPSRSITLESGVTVTGGQVFIASGQGGATLKSGSTITTIGQADNVADFESTGLQYRAPLVLSNGTVMLAPSPFGVVVEDNVTLLSEGSIGFASTQNVRIGTGVRFGTRDLRLSSDYINLGTTEALDAAAADGLLPAGFSMNQQVFDLLVSGEPGASVPGIQNLFLTANSAINVYGSLELSTVGSNGAATLDQLVLTTPSIYGFGTAQDQVRIVTDTLVWQGQATNTGVVVRPSALLPGGPGTGLGSFEFSAREIVFGYPELSQAYSTRDFPRLMLGFSEVTLRASEQITANNRGHLAVYASGPNPGTTYTLDSYAGVGGALQLVTPLLTSEPGGVMQFRTGGSFSLTMPEGAARPARTSALGGDLTLSADSILIDSSIGLASGRLKMTARGDITLGAGAQLDLAGQPVTFFDVTKYGWGGEIVAESLSGAIIQEDGAVIDVSARNSDAGWISLSALDPTNGRVTLNGTLLGTADEGFRSGSIDIRAQRLGDTADLTAEFAVLNGKLNQGAFGGQRAFSLKQGDLVLDDEVQAHEVVVSVDGGNLTVNGRIDASGSAPGIVRLSASGNLTLAAGSVLDVSGSELAVDSYGQAIDAKNRGSIELTAREGTLTLASGATLDLSSPDGVARGRIDLNASRVSETGGDVRIAAGGPLSIDGAASIALNAFWRYSPTDASGTIVQNNGGGQTGSPVSASGVLGLDQIDGRSVAFMTAAAGNASLTERTAGLTSYGTAFHFRPGVEIASEGALTVSGDLDLAKYRYGPDADRDPTSLAYGAGDPLSLVVRAGGDLRILGSISDGFTSSPAVTGIYENYVANILTDTRFIPYETAYTELQSGQTVVLTRDWTVTLEDLGSTARTARPRDTNLVQYPIGSTIPEGTVLDRVRIANGRAGLFENAFAETQVRAPQPAYAATSPLAPLLAAGSLSADLRFVSGADLAAADSRAMRAVSALAGGGNTVMGATPAEAMLLQPNVVRTGTGSIDIRAGGSISQASLYGVYTAGTQIAVEGADRYSGLAGAYFTDNGGDLSIVAQRDFSSRAVSYNASTPADRNYSFDVSNWLLRQGDHLTDTPAAWAVRFGSGSGSTFRGFSGFGTLGGGNINVEVGGDAGNLTPSTSSGLYRQSTGILFAVGGTGRVVRVDRDGSAVTGGELAQTGGGDLTVRIGGRLNPGVNTSDNGDDMNGTFVNVRGDISVQAASIGVIALSYASRAYGDPRATDPFAAINVDNRTGSRGGPVLVPGDTEAVVRTRGDLVLGGVGDPGQIGRGSWFSLWQPETAIELFSGGGNLTPIVANLALSPGSRGELASVNEFWNDNRNSILTMLPSQFRAIAAGGSIYYAGGDPNWGAQGYTTPVTFKVAPSTLGQLELLAQESISGAAVTVGGIPWYPARFEMSGAPSDPNSIPNPFKPALSEATPGFSAFEADTIVSYNNVTDDPIRVYAVQGDLVNVVLGEHAEPGDLATQPLFQRRIAAKPVWARSGRDIVNFGNGAGGAEANRLPGYILHRDMDDVSILSAGRDIRFARLRISGPGALEVTAGRNIYQGDVGSLDSLGAIVPGDSRPGSAISLIAGAGTGGLDYAAIRARYLDPSNLADPERPLADPQNEGKAVKVYSAELVEWLREVYGFVGAGEEALVYFDQLSPENQQIFLRKVFFWETREGGREYNDPANPRFASYLRGREAIATAFRDTDADGNTLERQGDIIMFGGSGVRTNFGGDIDLLAPGGQIVVGIQGEVPPASAGIVTQGQGDIFVFSEGSLLLGLSRLLTTFGGDIFAWSEEGDINAGRGAKTTVLYTPPRRIYDSYGNVALSPQTPSSGAGIGTLNPIPEVEPGDIDLVAPLGTIDAGEAGIRVSGNINLAALQVLNAANIQVQGEAAGIPTAVVVNTGALTAASSATTAVANQAADLAERSRPPVRTELPTILNVRFLGFGE